MYWRATGNKMTGAASHLSYRHQGSSQLRCWPSWCNPRHESEVPLVISSVWLEDTCWTVRNCFCESWPCLEDWFPSLSVLSHIFHPGNCSSLLATSCVWEHLLALRTWDPLPHGIFCLERYDYLNGLTPHTVQPTQDARMLLWNPS